MILPKILLIIIACIVAILFIKMSLIWRNVMQERNKYWLDNIEKLRKFQNKS